jgi:hypothetical protein
MNTTDSGHDDPVSLSEAVVSSVATQKGVGEIALPPLFEVLDPDALDALFETSGDRTEGHITFEYAGCTVECVSDGTVRVDGPTD